MPGKNWWEILWMFIFLHISNTLIHTDHGSHLCCWKYIDIFLSSPFWPCQLWYDFAGSASDTERKLVYDLIEGPGYNPLIRPVQNVSKSIKVQFGITLFQVISVDERTQVMKTNNWIRMVSVLVLFDLWPALTFFLYFLLKYRMRKFCI